MTKIKRQVATYKQRREAEDLLRASGEMRDGLFVYQDGCSDAAIAEIVGCTHNSVAHVREQVFGKLLPSRPKLAPTAPSAEATAQAEKIAERLEIMLIDVKTLFLSLETNKEAMRRLDARLAALELERAQAHRAGKSYLPPPPTIALRR